MSIKVIFNYQYGKDDNPVGRLPSDNPKKNRFEIRLTDEELHNIDFIARQLGISRTEAVLNAIEFKYFQLLDYLKENPHRRR